MVHERAVLVHIVQFGIEQRSFPPPRELSFLEHLFPQPDDVPVRVSERAAPQRAQHQPPVPVPTRRPQHGPHPQAHRLFVLRPAVRLPPVLERHGVRVADRCHGDNGDDGQVLRLGEVEDVVAVAEAGPHHDDAGRVDRAVLRDRVELASQAHAQRGAVAHRFFLREGALQPAAAGDERVREVEDEHGPRVAGAAGGKLDGDVETVAVDDADGGGREVGTSVLMQAVEGRVELARGGEGGG